MNDDSSPILDYASPRKRQRLRMPARSSLEVRSDRDELLLIETLKGQVGAVLGLVFAVVILLAMAFIFASPEEQYHLLWQQVAFVGLLVATEVGLMLAVIHQTWRKTQLTVRHAEMLLAFTSPMYRKHYRWVGDDIADILAVDTANQNTPAALSELLITRVRGGDIHLFTDHFTSEIRPLSEVLIAIFRCGEQIMLPPPMR